MELAQILKTLLARKLALVPVFIIAFALAIFSAYKPSTNPPGLKARALEYGAATQQVLVDSSQSALADLNRDTGPLSVRASVYAQFMRSSAIVGAIAKRMGIPAELITTQGPFATVGFGDNITQPGVSRANQVRAETERYRLAFDAQENLPVITVYAQAPDAEKAIALSAAAVDSLKSYVEELQKSDSQLKAPVTIRPLGPPDGGMVTKGARKAMIMLVFLLVSGLGCAVIVVFASIRKGWKQLGVDTPQEAEPFDFDTVDGLAAPFNGRAPRESETVPR